MIECECGHTFPVTLAPCPDGLVGCCVAHFDTESYKCSKCGYDSGPDIGKAIMEGRVVYEVGISVVNLKAVANLKLYTEE